MAPSPGKLYFLMINYDLLVERIMLHMYTEAGIMGKCISLWGVCIIEFRSSTLRLNNFCVTGCVFSWWNL